MRTKSSRTSRVAGDRPHTSRTLRVRSEASGLATLTPIARRARTIAVGLAIAAFSVGFAACGNDEQDEANEAVDNAQEQLESALDEVDTEEAQAQAEDAQEQIESAVDEIDTEALQQQAEEAQKEFEQQYGGGN